MVVGSGGGGAWALALALLFIEARAQLPPVAGGCGGAVLNMASCLTFVKSGSTLDKPQGNCCQALKKAVKEQGEAACLCSALKGSAGLGIPISLAKAAALPAACGVSDPSLSQCTVAAGGPVTDCDKLAMYIHC